jgi:hypothetical protein
MDKPTRTDRALNVSDTGASLIAGVLGIAGTLGFLSKLGITVDEGAAILGFVGMVVAAVRGRLEKGRRARFYRADVAEIASAFPLEELEAILKRRKDAENTPVEPHETQDDPESRADADEDPERGA